MVVGATAFHLYPELLRLDRTATVTITQSREDHLSHLKVLADTAYFEELKRVLPRANRSVYVIMYVIKYDPKEPDDPVNQLLNVLAHLASKGIDVKVLVDDETSRSYGETITFLKTRNVYVKLDESARRTTHTKVVIVDEEVALVGSHNWTESALTSNSEVSVYIRDLQVLRTLVAYFMGAWSSGRLV